MLYILLLSFGTLLTPPTLSQQTPQTCPNGTFHVTRTWSTKRYNMYTDKSSGHDYKVVACVENCPKDLPYNQEKGICVEPCDPYYELKNYRSGAVCKRQKKRVWADRSACPGHNKCGQKCAKCPYRNSEKRVCHCMLFQDDYSPRWLQPKVVVEFERIIS
jgi:hypothetical protein